MKVVKKGMVLGVFLCLGLHMFAQNDVDLPAATESALVDSAAAGALPDFGMTIDIGYLPLYSAAAGGMQNWQHLGFAPEIVLGKFGVGLNLDFNFRFNGGINADSFEIRPEDWVATDFAGFLETYLPKIRFVRYGAKGDSLYLSFGDIPNGRLGNGFIVNGYTNTLQPGQRIFGMSFDLDGQLFDFPWIGIETMVGNFAAWDLLAMRLYTRPAAKSGVSLLEPMQIGVTLAIDTNPFYYAPVPAIKANSSGTTAGIWGIDFLTPLLSIDPFSLNLVGDLALQNLHFGAQMGVTGNIIKVIGYTFLLRFNSANFLPEYFDNLYDISRVSRLAAYLSTTTSGTPYAGWLASLGFNLLAGALYFNATMDGPFTQDTSLVFPYPDLKVVLGLKPGVLAGLSLEAHFYKTGISSWESLVDGTNTLAGAKLEYAMGPAVLGIVYDLSYDPYAALKGMDTNWVVSSRIETSIVLLGSGVKK